MWAALSSAVSVFNYLNLRLGEAFLGPKRDGLGSYQVIRLLEQEQGTHEIQRIGRGSIAGAAQPITFVCNRTGVRTTFTADADGHLPRDARVDAARGDTFDVHGRSGKKVFTIHTPDADWFWDSNWSARPPVIGDLQAQKIEPTAGSQGRLGDCWLLGAALGIAAACPERIRGMFSEKAGRVAVQLFDYQPSGDYFAPVSYLVDGNFPNWVVSTDHDDDSLPDPHVWLPLIEKAMAARRGSYPGLRSGSPAFAFESILGTKATELDLSELSVKELEEILRAAVKQKLPMAVSSGVRLIHRLANYHVYAVRAVEEENGRMKVQLQNPWGWAHHTLSAKGLKDWAGYLSIGGELPARSIE